MMFGQQFTAINPSAGVIFILIALWDLFWKGQGLWYAAKKGQTYWFVAMLILNTAGILPLLYLYVFGGKKR